MRHPKICGLLVATVLFVPGFPTARAADEPASVAVRFERPLNRAKFQDVPVRVPLGERVGKIADVVVDLFTGDVPFVFVQLRQDEGWIALMPVEVGKLSVREENWRWRIPEGAVARIRQTRHQPGGGDPNYSQGLEWLGLFDVESAWQQRIRERDDKVNLATGAALVQTTVSDLSGQPLGRIVDVVVDRANWKVAYMVLERQRESDDSEPPRYAVPLSAFRQGKTRREWVLELDAEKQSGLTPIPKGEIPRVLTDFWTDSLKAVQGTDTPVGLRPPLVEK